jgi:hypothetical protein
VPGQDVDAALVAPLAHLRGVDRMRSVRHSPHLPHLHGIDSGIFMPTMVLI